MKKVVVVSVLLLIPVFLFSQPTKRKNIHFSIGVVNFSGIHDHNNNFALGVGYQNRFSEFFAWEAFYEFGHSRFKPNDIDGYIRSLNWNNVEESSNMARNIHIMYNNVLGAKIHASFVNNDRWFFSINFGLGYHLTRTGFYNLYEVATTINLTEGTVSLRYYNADWIEKTYAHPIYRVGLQVHYTIYRDWIIGLDLGLTKEIDSPLPIMNSPPVPDNYKATIIIGKKF